jgi:hypothetical protein
MPEDSGVLPQSLPVILTMDTDPKGRNLPNFNNTYSFDYEHLIDRMLLDLRHSIWKLTCFVSTDIRVEQSKGSALYLWEFFQDKTHFDIELGWHPWFEGGHQDGSSLEYRKTFKKERPTAVRVCGGNMNNEQLAELYRQGFTVDCTALPGIIRTGERPFDWGTTTQSSYLPSTEDYKVTGDSIQGILEVPTTTILSQAPYDQEPKLRYCNPLYQPKIFYQMLKTYFNSGDLGDHLTLIFHPDELEEGFENDLYCYGVKNLLSNLGTLELYAREQNVRVKPLLMREFTKRLKVTNEKNNRG